jgi:hypothetical protein
MKLKKTGINLLCSLAFCSGTPQFCAFADFSTASDWERIPFRASVFPERRNQCSLKINGCPKGAKATIWLAEDNFGNKAKNVHFFEIENDKEYCIDYKFQYEERYIRVCFDQPSDFCFSASDDMAVSLLNKKQIFIIC